jgi:hypothetical protein
MYAGTTTLATATGAAATLPYTGTGPLTLLFVAMGGFAVLAAGAAIRRMLPRNEA